MKLMNFCAVIALSGLFSMVSFAINLVEVTPGLLYTLTCKSKRTGETRSVEVSTGSPAAEQTCRRFGEEYYVPVPQAGLN